MLKRRNITTGAVFAALAVLLPFAAVSYASVHSINETTNDFELTEAIEWYQYDTGTKLNVTANVADAFVNTEIDGGGQVVLANVGLNIPGSINPTVTPPWWDAALRARQCSSVSGSGVQYVDVPFSSNTPAGWAASGWIQADYGDLIPTVWDGVTQTVAPFWLATPYDTADGHAFVEIDFGVGGSRDVCLNFGSAAGGQTTASTPMLGQNWLGFRAVYERVDPVSTTTYFVSNPTLLDVQVANNAAGAGPFTLPAGGTATLTLGADDTVYANGAVAVRGTNLADANDSYAPLFHQSQLFVSGVNRRLQRWCFAGSAGTTLEIVTATNPMPTPVTTNFTLGSGAPDANCVVADTGGGTRITASAPVSVYHFSTGPGGAQFFDAFPLYPATPETLYGTPSRNLGLAADIGGDVRVQRSDGSDTTFPLNAAPDHLGIGFGGSGAEGNSPTVAVTPADGLAIGAVEKNDGTGNDATTLLPIEAMSSRYVLPAAAAYVAIACPSPGETILVGGVANTCAGVGVGKLRLGFTPSGTVLESQSGAAFTLYYDALAPDGKNDDTNLFVPRFNWAHVKAAPGPIQTAPLTGTWTSAPSEAVTDVWGLFDANQTVPANTTVTWEIGCAAISAGPFVFASIAVGDPLAHSCDDNDWVQVRATLSTTDPLASPAVIAGCPEYDLLLAGDSAVEFTLPAPDTGSAGAAWMYRVHAPDLNVSDSYVETRTFAATSDWVLSLVDDPMTGFVDQVAGSSGGTAINVAAGPVPIHRQSVFIAYTAPVVGPDVVVWRTDSAGVWAERTLTIAS